MRGSFFPLFLLPGPCDRPLHSSRRSIAVRVIACMIIFLLLPPVIPAIAETTPNTHIPPYLEVDLLMQRAMAKGLVAGGVVLVGNRSGTLLERTYGKRSYGPDAPPTTPDTIFDIASLTKVVATTPAIMKLAEEGRLSLVDPLVRWFPEFAGKGKDSLLVMNLLTHTSGLDDFPLSSVDPMRSAVAGAASQRLKGEPGNRFKYADINFILLGELVRRVSGLTLDRYVADNFLAPIGMVDTGFNPPKEKFNRCAATMGSGKSPHVGEVQDQLSRQLSGVAGHAGVFTTARDLALFCRMIMNDGVISGRRILSSRAVEQMTAPYFSRGGKVVRGLGWDIASPFSAPRGNGFSEMSFGHTGYSGTSIWIDPEEDTFVILLTSRLEYRNLREFNQLRSDVSTFAAAIYAAERRDRGADMVGGD